ncbi:MAG TPA: hypothetical protein VF200_12255, partial [Woeseiaceae bacterium]
GTTPNERSRDRGEVLSAPATSTSLWACGLGIHASHAAERTSPRPRRRSAGVVPFTNNAP